MSSPTDIVWSDNSMRSPFSKAASIFFNPETLLPFLIGSIFLAVLGSAVWEVLFSLVTDLNDNNALAAAVQLAIGSLLIFLLSVLLFARGLKQLEPETLADARTPIKHRGLILLVSREEPCRVAIQHHADRLERCWLLHSDQTKAMAVAIADTYSGNRMSFKLIHVNDIYDPMEFFQHIRRIYDQLPIGWLPQQVMADYTGMTAHGSVGMVLASLSPKAPLQYTPVNPNRSNESMTPIEIALRSSVKSAKR
ncbi:CRISPR-associated protein [Adonisia turfae]|nr:CRISPR-associated protein [Adonisia turfae]